MPLTLQKLLKKTSHVSVKVDEEDVIEVEYYPAMITEKVIAQMQELSSAQNQEAENVVKNFTLLNEIIMKLVKSWDIFEDEKHKHMYPLTQDKLSDLPILIRMSVVYGIFGDIRPNEIAPQTTKTEN